MLNLKVKNKETKMEQNFLEWIYKGVFVAFISFLASLKSVLLTFQWVLIVFTLDIIFGYLENKKNKGEKFDFNKIWGKAFPRLIVAMVAVTCGFILDKYAPNELFKVSLYLTWLSFVAFALSILKNALAWSGEMWLLDIIDIVENLKNKLRKRLKNE